MEKNVNIKVSEKQSDSFYREYEHIMKTSENTVIVDVQWAEKGDYFQKLSMYDNYTPVKTSGDTTLISEI